MNSYTQRQQADGGDDDDERPDPAAEPGENPAEQGTGEDRADSERLGNAVNGAQLA
jgi:hypothetical protein